MALYWTIHVLAIAVMAVLVCDGWELTDPDVETIAVINLGEYTYFTDTVDYDSETGWLQGAAPKNYANIQSKYNVKRVEIEVFNAHPEKWVADNIQAALGQCKGYTTLKLSGCITVDFLPAGENLNALILERFRWNSDGNILAFYPDIPHLTAKFLYTNFLDLNLEPVKKLVSLHLEMGLFEYQEPRTGAYMQLDESNLSKLTKDIVQSANTLTDVTIIPCPQELAREIKKLPYLEKARLDIGSMVQWRKDKDVEINYFRLSIGKSGYFNGFILNDLPCEFQQLEVVTSRHGAYIDFIIGQLWAWVRVKDESERKNIIGIVVTLYDPYRLALEMNVKAFLPSLKYIHLNITDSDYMDNIHLIL